MACGKSPHARMVLAMALVVCWFAGPLMDWPCLACSDGELMILLYMHATFVSRWSRTIFSPPYPHIQSNPIKSNNSASHSSGLPFIYVYMGPVPGFQGLGGLRSQLRDNYMPTHFRAKPALRLCGRLHLTLAATTNHIATIWRVKAITLKQDHITQC